MTLALAPQEPVIRGYLGALEHMRDQQGRVFDASMQLAAPNAGALFPTIQVGVYNNNGFGDDQYTCVVVTSTL